MLSSLLALALAAPLPQMSYEQTVKVTRDGRPAGSSSARVYWSGRRVRMERGDDALVLQLDTGQAFRLVPSQKVAVQLDVERLRSRAQLDLATASEALDAGENANVRSAPSGPARSVAGFSCQPHRVRTATATFDVCVSTALPVGMEAFTEYLEWSGASDALPGLVEALRRLAGFPLETRARVEADGQVWETTSTITKLTLGPQPVTLFEPPAGWRLEHEGSEDEEP